MIVQQFVVRGFVNVLWSIEPFMCGSVDNYLVQETSLSIRAVKKEQKGGLYFQGIVIGKSSQFTLQLTATPAQTLFLPTHGAACTKPFPCTDCYIGHVKCNRSLGQIHETQGLPLNVQMEVIATGSNKKYSSISSYPLNSLVDFWEKASLILEPMEGLHQVTLVMNGKDSRFWRGEYGSKVCHCSIGCRGQKRSSKVN
jgi:hypothetical protein